MAECIFAGVLVSFFVYIIIMVVLKVHNKKQLPPYIILTDGNSKDSIEGIIRSHIRALHNQGSADFSEITVIVPVSEFQTLAILNKLRKKFPFVKVIVN